MADEKDTSTGTENQEGTTQGPDGAADAKRFTQKDLEVVIAKRLQRAKTDTEKAVAAAKDEAIAAFREEHGIDDAVLARVGEGLAGEDAQTKAEMRRMKAESTKAKNQHDALSAKYARRGELIRKALVVDVLLREAAGKFVDPQDAVDKLGHRFRFDEETDTVYIVDEKGEPSAQTVQELIADLLTQKPHLAVPTGVPGTGARQAAPPVPRGNASKAKTQAERVAMLQSVLAEK